MIDSPALSAPSSPTRPFLATFRQRMAGRWLFALLLLAGCGVLTVLVLAPLYTLLSKSVENKAGEYVGLDNFAHYL
ncbi:MAG: putative 2-aminoethylphosphonate ABC transporter permease subunit, partial [Gammaproteobacteria bacterium]